MKVVSGTTKVVFLTVLTLTTRAVAPKIMRSLLLDLERMKQMVTISLYAIPGELTGVKTVTCTFLLKVESTLVIC